MNDQEIAAYLRDQCSRRMSGYEIAVVSGIAEGVHLNADGQWLGVNDQRVLEGLKTQFASELANVKSMTVPTTNDGEVML